MSKAWREKLRNSPQYGIYKLNRKVCLERANYVCELKLDGCTWEATEAHHVRGLKAGDGLDNLQASCKRCNVSLGDPLRYSPLPNINTVW